MGLALVPSTGAILPERTSSRSDRRVVPFLPVRAGSIRVVFFFSPFRDDPEDNVVFVLMFLSLWNPAASQTAPSS